MAQAFLLLRIAFTVAPILFGLDKFANVLTDDWTRYLSDTFNSLLPGSAATGMHIVGVVEIAAGLVVAVAPRFGGYLVAAWLGGIIVNLLIVGGYGDIALRDFGLMLGALTLTRLASVYPAGPRSAAGAEAPRARGAAPRTGRPAQPRLSGSRRRRRPTGRRKEPRMAATDSALPTLVRLPRRAAARRRPRTSTARWPCSRCSARAARCRVRRVRRGRRPRPARQGDRGRRVGQRPRRPQPDGRARAAVRGRGGPRRAAEPHLRRVGPRARRGAPARAGELRRARPLGRRRATARRSARRRRPPTRRCGG